MNVMLGLLTMCNCLLLSKHPLGGSQPKEMFIGCLLVMLLCVSTISSTTLEMYNYTEARTKTQLQKVIVVSQNGTDDVIVGGRNWLLRLDGNNLGLRQSVQTGPGNDTGDDVDNDASVLVRVPGDVRYPLVLYCGTRQYGLCSIYSGHNLDDRKSLAADNTLNTLGNKNSTVAFFGKGNLNLIDQKKHVVTPGLALYVGTSYDGRPMEFASKAVSARVLTRIASQEYNISYVFDKPRFNQTSATDIVPSLKTSYLVDYIYGFEHRGFSYFLTVQKHLPYDDNGYVTHLVRVCQNDLPFNSYTEVQLSCRKVEYQPRTYNIARAAHLSTVGKEMIYKYGLGLDEEVLYVAFGWSGRHSGGSTALPEYGSAVCMYPMSKVRTAFTRAQAECYLGRSEWPSWIVLGGDHAKCNDVKDILPLNDDFCGRSENKAVQARFPMDMVANITTRTLVTALNVFTYGNKTIAVLGTHTGLVHKTTIDGTNKGPFATIDVASQTNAEDPMVTDMALSTDRKYAYVLTANKVTKVPIQSCSVHTDCGGCVLAGDPLGCGWCENRCSIRKECKGRWYDKTCPPVIHSFSPSSGPVEGGTWVDIIGDNFGTRKMDSGSPEVKVALSRCNITFFNWTHISCTTNMWGGFSSDIEVYVTDPTSVPAVEGSARSAPAIFEYMSAYLLSFEPRFGPRSGGTILTISGTNLNIGSSTTVTVAHLPCAIRSVTSTSIECETAPWQSEFVVKYGTSHRRRRSPKTKGEVEVKVDNARLTLNQAEFEYANDPIILDVMPQESILSGGLRVTVKGENLNTVVRPRMMAKIVGRNGTVYQGDCDVHKDGEVMICITPTLPGTKAISVDVYFLMDGVEELRDFPTTHPSLSRFRYFVDPTFTKFRNGLKTFYLDQTVLDIWGNNMDMLAQTDVITVMVGSKPCNVSKVGTTLVLCNPERPPEGKDIDLSLRYAVTVTMGNLHAEIGELQFSLPTTYKLKYLIPSCAALVVFILVVISVFYKRRVLRKRWFKLKAMPGEPNVHYATHGTRPDSAVHRTERREGTDESRTVTENSYFPTRGGRRMHPVSPPTLVTPDPVIDDEARRLIDDANLLISRDHLLLLEVIGQGHFGCVYRGFMKFESCKEEVEVAVKTLKSLTVGASHGTTHFHPSVDHATTTTQPHPHNYTTSVECRKFLDEALRMREFDHPNILRLIGIALDKENMPLVVLPFMKHGDLLSYIRNEQNSPTVKQLMDFGIQIAEGMAYLATLKFVHRDLAARNCMLDDTMNVKVADFGLSRDIYERDYYSSDDPKAKLPVKWMAPESLEKGTYDTKTDVWSYGVVLWELMTRGVCPYPEVDNWDIIKFLKEGRRMPQPSYCPDALYSIMLQCWHDEAKLRLTFEELVHEVKGIILCMERAHEKVGLNVTYVNVPLAQPYLYPQNHDRSQLQIQQQQESEPGDNYIGAGAVGAVGAGAIGGLVTPEAEATAGAMPVCGVNNIATISNGNARLYPQAGLVQNGTIHRLSYHGIPAPTNATSRSTLV